MTHSRRSVVDAVTNPANNFFAFLFIGTILFSLLSDGVSDLFWENFGDWLQQQLGIESQAVLLLAFLLLLIVVVLLIIYGTGLSRQLRKLLSRFGLIDAVTPEQAKVKPLEGVCSGLVVVMSPKDDSPAEVAIRHHWNGGQDKHLKHCWIICTEQSLPFAEAMHQRLIADGLGGRVSFHYGNYEVSDTQDSEQKRSLMVPSEMANDPNYILQVVNGIYGDAERLNLVAADVIVDFTGGTKPLGVGAFLSCTDPERRLEYIAQGPTTEILEIDVAYRLKAMG